MNCCVTGTDASHGTLLPCLVPSDRVRLLGEVAHHARLAPDDAAAARIVAAPSMLTGELAPPNGPQAIGVGAVSGRSG